MYRAKETFWAPDNRRVVKGDLVAAHDTVISGREELFEAVVIPQALEPSPVSASQQETEPPPPNPQTPATGDPTAPGDEKQPPTPAPVPAAKKTAAKRTTTATRTPAGGATK